MRRAVSVLITSVLTGFVVINLSAGRSDGQAHGGASGTISLQKAIRTALRHNPELSAARHDLEAASWRVRKSYLDLLPKVDMDFGYTRLDNATVRRANIFVPVGRELVRQFAPDQDPDDIRPGAWEDNYGTTITVVQPIYNGGAGWASVSLAQAMEVASRHSLEETRQDVILRTKRAYFDVLKAQEMVALMREALKSTQEHLESARKMLKAGMRSRADVLRWEVKLAGDECNLVRAENALAIARAALKEVMGVSFETEFDLVPVGGGAAELEESLKELIDTALRFHPGIKAMEANVDAQRAGVRLAWAGFQPKINFVYSYGWERNNTLALDGYTNWSAAVTVSFPIFHSFSEYANLRKARSDLKRLEAMKESLKRGIAVQVTGASLKVRSALHRLKIAQKGVDYAEENLKVVTNKYKVGVASNMDFIDAQVAYTQAKADRINALYDYYIAKAELERAIGGGR